MAWRTVVITKHCKISSKLNLLVVQTDDAQFQFPIADVGTVIVATTRAVITTNAIAAILERNIALVCCGSNGIPEGELVSYHANGNRRANIVRQMNWDETKKNRLWQTIVQNKILHQALVLERNNLSGYEQIQHLSNTVQEGDLDNREAVAAHMYFPRLYSYEFVRSDDSNPINALLNYGYSIILSEVTRQIVGSGFLAEFGIHHDNDKNPFNLACDFMEPFRPFVDNLVFNLEDKTLNPQIKTQLISLMREDNSDLGSSISKVIALFVQDSLRFLSEDLPLPELGFLK